MESDQVSIDFVDQYELLDSDTEEIAYTKDLKDGMIVLIESPAAKMNVGPFQILGWDKSEMHMALANNRWCTVTQFDMGTGGYVFVGVYEDGTKFVRRYPAMYTWFVKKTDPKPLDENPIEGPIRRDGSCAC